MKTIALIGATFTGNRGAEAILTTAIGRIGQIHPDAHFHVFSYYPKDDARVVNREYITIHDASPLSLVAILFPFSMLLALFKTLKLKKLAAIFPQSVRALNASQALIDLAGVSFIDGRERFLPFNVLTILPAILLGVPVVKFSQALGPFNGHLNRLAARLVLKRCRMIFARGRQTFEHLLSLPAMRDKIAMAADVAFLQKKGDSLSNENTKPLNDLLQILHNKKSEEAKIIGVCPSSVLAQQFDSAAGDYAGAIAEICAGLAGAGHAVVLFPNATRGNVSNLRNNDVPVIRNIFGKLKAIEMPGARIFKADFDLNTDGIKDLISLCDAVAVSRFHAMVAALSLGIPALIMGWSHKYGEVMSDFGLDQYVFDFASATPADLTKSFQELLSKKDAISAAIMAELPKIRQSASKQFDYVNGILEDSPQ